MTDHRIPAVILAGGLGTRMREETEFRPKPMVEIGSMPILWHIMMNLSEQGIKEFIVCTGYKSKQIKDFFLNYVYLTGNFTVDLRNSEVKMLSRNQQDWKVTVVDTGLNTETGGRIKAIEQYLDHERFLVTYGDGLADINIGDLINSHIVSRKKATVTAVRPESRFGVMEISEEMEVRSFREKPQVDNYVNGGFLVLEKDIFKVLSHTSSLELDLLPKLVKSNDLNAFPHQGFWQSMDTYRDITLLNELWKKNSAPWKNWKNR